MLEEKSKELGRLLGQSAEYQAVKRSNDAITGDRPAMELLRRMEELRVDAQRRIERGEEPGEELERELDELLSQVQGNPAYQRVLVAQENFEKVMARVNEWILEGIRAGSASRIITLE